MGIVIVFIFKSVFFVVQTRGKVHVTISSSRTPVGPLWPGSQWVKLDYERVFLDPGMLHQIHSLPIEQENEWL